MLVCADLLECVWLCGRVKIGSYHAQSSLICPILSQSPDKHRQAIAELAAATEAQRTYYAQLGSTAIDNDRKLEMIGKV